MESFKKGKDIDIRGIFKRGYQTPFRTMLILPVQPNL